MKSGDNRIAIELPKGLKLVAEQNVNPEYQNEIYVGIETSDGIWHQDLAVIRNAYFIDDNVELRDDGEQLSLPLPNRYQDKKRC